MKNNIAFFTHYTDAYHNGKFLLLRAYYGGEKGWAMEAKFWALNCIIGQAENARLDLSSKIRRAEVVKALDLSLAELDDFLRILSSEEEGILLLKTEKGVYWTEQTQEDLGRAVAAREEAKRRRERRVGLPSGDESQTSGDERGTSGDEMHGQEGEEEGDRTGENSKSASCARETELVDNSPPRNPAEEADLFAFALRRVTSRKRKPDNPEAMAEKIMLKPDVLRDWRKARMPPPAPEPSELAPTCPDCGRPARIITTGPGEAPQAQCQLHGRSWTYRGEAEGWIEDRPPEAGPEVPPPGMCPACGAPLQVDPEDPLRAACRCGARFAFEADWGWTAPTPALDTG